MDNDNEYIELENDIEQPVKPVNQYEELVNIYFDLLPITTREQLIKFLELYDYNRSYSEFAVDFNRYYNRKILGLFVGNTIYPELENEIIAFCDNNHLEYLELTLSQKLSIVQSIIPHDGFTISEYIYIT